MGRECIKTKIQNIYDDCLSGVSATFLLQCYPNQPICLVSHKQRNVQHIIIQLQVIQREPDPEFDLIREQFFEFLEAPAGGIGFRLDLHRKNIVFPLNQEIHLIRRIRLCPVPGSPFKLCNQSLKHKVFG